MHNKLNTPIVHSTSSFLHRVCSLLAIYVIGVHVQLVYEPSDEWIVTTVMACRHFACIYAWLAVCRPNIICT